MLVFDREANGNVAPIRVIKGPDTQLGASALAVDPVNNVLVVSGRTPGGRDRRTYLRIFNRTDEGNVKPKRVIGGPKSGLRQLGGPFTVYPPRGEIIASVRGEAGLLASDESYVAVWSIEDDGDVPPHWKIGGPKGVLRMPRGWRWTPKTKVSLLPISASTRC